jgi:exodeoxyribonuclease VIII
MLAWPPSSTGNNASAEVVYDLPDDDYRKRPGIAQSTLREMLHSPAHYAAALQKDKPRTADQKFGTAFHRLLLEPFEFLKLYLVKPATVSLRTKAGVEWFESAVRERGFEPELIDQDEHATLLAMKEAFMAAPLAREAIEKSHHEVSVFAPSPNTSHDITLLRKMRIDLLPSDGTALGDIKTTGYGKGSFSTWPKVVADMRYHLQAAYYLDGINDATGDGDRYKQFIHFVIEKDPPHAVGLYEIDPVAISIGRETYRRLLDEVAWCVKEQAWPAYSQELTRISLPRWAVT